MDTALKKEYAPLKARSSPKLPYGQLVTSDKFRTNIQQIGELQRKRDLIYSLQEILTKLNQPGLSHFECAYNLQDFFEQLIFAETGLHSIKHGLRMFIDKLYAEPVITKLIHYIFKEMQKYLNLRQANQAGLDTFKLTSAARELLTWYIDRSSNIENLFQGEDLLGDSYDRIINLQVFHDQKKHNFMGLEVSAGLLLYGRAGQNLWFKVFVKQQGEYVLPHVDWNSWIDDTEVFTMKPVDEDVALSGILPITPCTQRLIIDRMNIFIPYCALDLPPGKHEVEIESCLFNEKGDLLLSAASNEVVSVARNNRSTKAVISEQALGIWSKDYVSGDAINDLQVVCIQQPNDSRLGDIIRINFDFEIYDRMGESLFIEVRFYNSNGSLIKTTNNKDKDQYMAVRSEVPVDEIIFKRFGLEMAVPRTQLKADEEDLRLSCEVCLLSYENKVLCGALENFQLPERRVSEKLQLEPKIVSKPEINNKDKGLLSRLWSAKK